MPDDDEDIINKLSEAYKDASNDVSQQADAIINGEDQEAEGQETEKPDARMPVLSAKQVAHSLQDFSKIMARKLKIKEIELDNNDVNDLENGLIPLEPYFEKWIMYLPYLPLILFGIGYGARVYMGWKDKKELEKKEKKDKADKDKNKGDQNEAAADTKTG